MYRKIKIIYIIVLSSSNKILYLIWKISLSFLDKEFFTEFSNTLDESLINIKNKDKEKTAQSLAKLYNFLPDFINSTEMECIKKNSIDAKHYSSLHPHLILKMN